jgi:hypothetical protein
MPLITASLNFHAMSSGVELEDEGAPEPEPEPDAPDDAGSDEPEAPDEDEAA